MSIDPSGHTNRLTPGLRVRIKSGTFEGMQGLVKKVTNCELESGPADVVLVEVAVRDRIAPVEFINPGPRELEAV